MTKLVPLFLMALIVAASSAFAETIPANCKITYNGKLTQVNAQVVRGAVGPGVTLLKDDKYELEINLYNDAAVLSITSAKQTHTGSGSLVNSFSSVEFQEGDKQQKSIRLASRTFVDSIVIWCNLN